MNNFLKINCRKKYIIGMNVENNIINVRFCGTKVVKTKRSKKSHKSAKSKIIEKIINFSFDSK